MEDNRRILIIDDNEAIHSDFRKVLGSSTKETETLDDAAAALFNESDVPLAARRHYEIDSAYQGQEGLEMVRRARDAGCPYALAFVDVRMPPGWDGIETAQHLWELDPDLQVVICTAYSDYSWNDMVGRLGETDRLLVIKKPFDNIEVRQIACAMTTKWVLAREAGRTLEDLTRMVDEKTAAISESNRRLRAEISERQRTLEILREAEAHTGAIVDTAGDGIITIDEFGTIESFNPAAERMFLHTFEQILGQDIAILLPPQAAMRDRSTIIGKYVADGPKSPTGERIEIQGRRQDGKLFPLEIAITEANVAQHHWFTMIMRDLTQQKRLEARLVQSQKLEAVGQLASGIAHEINTPIQYIEHNLAFIQDAIETLLSNSELASDATRPPVEAPLSSNDSALSHLESIRHEAPAAIAQCLEGVGRVATIVRAMNDFAHPGKSEKVPADINRAIESAITISSNEWKRVAVVKTDLQPDLPCIECLPAEIHQVLLNIIVNASHAIEEAASTKTGPGVITISTHKAGDSVEIQIQDTGLGIPEDCRSRIFDPFFTTKDLGRGTGQGLTIAHAIVTQKHGGQIFFDTEDGAGTTFVIRLPINEPAPCNATVM